MWFKRDIADRLGALAGACYCIAAADGDVSAQEIRSMAETIQLLAGREVGLAEIERLLIDAEEAIARVGAAAFLSGLRQGMSEHGVSQLLGAAAYTIFADGTMTAQERAAYFALARAVGKPDGAAEAILAAVRAGVEDPDASLETEAEAQADAEPEPEPDEGGTR